MLEPRTRFSLIPFAIVSLFAAVPLFASVSVRSVSGSRLDVAIVREPFSRAFASIAPHLPYAVDVLTSSDPVVSYRGKGVSAETVLRAIVRSARLELATENDRRWIYDPRQRLVTLDVKDADVRTILGSIQKQCGIRNLIIDPQVQGSGTFYYRGVACDTALRNVLESLGLDYEIGANSVVSVGRAR